MTCTRHKYTKFGWHHDRRCYVRALAWMLYLQATLVIVERLAQVIFHLSAYLLVLLLVVISVIVLNLEGG